jgi:hypothetical protein
MHSWKKMVDLLDRINRPATLGFQADMAHTLLYILGYNAPEDALLPHDWDWSQPHRLDNAMKELTAALRPRTIDFHVAQNDATVKGSGTHDKTGHHCLPNDPNGKLKIAHHAGYWLHNPDGKLTKAIRHICWDGCMFPNDVMMKPETWNDILAAMISVRDAHGWREGAPLQQELPLPPTIQTPRKPATKQKPRRVPAKPAKKPSRKAKKIARRASTKTALKKKSRKTSKPRKKTLTRKPVARKKARRK